MLAAEDFNSGGNVHLPIGNFNTYFGPTRILYTTSLELWISRKCGAEFKTETFFVETAGIGFRQSKTDSDSTKTKLLLQCNRFQPE